MITKKRLKNIKENVYMRSEIATISGIGIDSSLKEELELIEEIDRLNNIINHIDSFVDRTIEIIKQQPSEDDTWILENLHSIKFLLQGSDEK